MSLWPSVKAKRVLTAHHSIGWRGKRQPGPHKTLVAMPLLEVAGLTEEVEIEAAPELLTIRSLSHPRASWAESAAAYEPDGLLDKMANTHFDEDE